MTEPNERWYVSHLDTNAKGLLSVDLHPLTIIEAPTRTHKTGLVQFLERAVVGAFKNDASASRVARARALPNTPADLMLYAPFGAKELFVEADLNRVAPPHDKARDSVRWAVGGTTARGKKSKVGEEGVACGVSLDRAAFDLLESDPTPQREALLRLVAPPDVLKGALDAIPTAHAELWTNLVEQAQRESGAKSEADLLLAAVDLVEAAVKRGRADRNAMRKVEPPEPYIGPPREELQAKIDRSRAAASTVARVEQAKLRLAHLRARLQDLKGAA